VEIGPPFSVPARGFSWPLWPGGRSFLKKYDYLIVGAGFAGLTLAERICTQLGKTCLVVEKRNHLGGNAYDYHDRQGVLVHAYGPHYFRTNSDEVREYLSQFTGWHAVEYRILSHTQGKFWSFPVNLKTFEQVLGRPSSTEEMEAWLESERVPCAEPRNSEELMLSRAGPTFYRMFFEGYTRKQWRREPRELDASVCGRIPLRTNRDDRYLNERFQALPGRGYTAMFEKMVQAAGDLLEVRRNTDYRQILSSVRFGHMIYTGPLDEYFGCDEGRLPYRSLRFEPESFSAGELVGREKIAGRRGFWQPAMQVNYPNEEAFTRIVEIKHATGQDCEGTTIVREYPADYQPGGEAYYPIPAPEAQKLAERYRDRARREAGVSFVGRLANYRYFNMDQIVALALAEFRKLEKAGIQPQSATL